MLITVFTPTYNRAYILPKLFESLKRQPFRDFEWIIVDDGSTDGTRELVEAMQEDCRAKFPIRYFYQVNSGKHVAWNRGLDEAEGTLFFPVDSDDYLTDDALSRISENCEAVMSNERLMALSGVRIFPGNKLTGGILQDNVGSYIDYSSINRRSKGITGDLAEAFVTERLRKYRFPVFEDERFVPEAVIFNRFSNDGYLIRGYAFPLYVCEYLADGYTKNTDRLLITNWKGYRLYVSELMHSKVGIKAKAIPFCGFMYRSLLRLLGLCKLA